MASMVESLNQAFTDLSYKVKRVNDKIPSGKDTPSYLGYPRSVREFGAYGDGVTDDTNALIAASKAVGVGSLYFPPGKYMVSNTIELPTDQIWFAESAMANTGKNSVIIKSSVATGPTVIGSHGSFRGILFYGPGALQNPNSTGIYHKGQAAFRDVAVFDFGVGIEGRESWYTHMDRVFFRYNLKGVRFDWCYNAAMYNTRFSCKNMTGGGYGVGIEMLNGSMVSMHGGSIEQYTVGLDLVGNRQSFHGSGVYMESYSPNSSGIRFGGQHSLSMFGSQVYLDNHKAWIDCGAGVASGSTIVSMGNEFKASANNTTGTDKYAYLYAAGTNLTAIGDDWSNVSTTGYKYRNTAALGAGIVIDPSGVAAPSGPPQNGVVLGGANAFGAENNRTVRLGAGGLPSTATNGEIRVDQADGKLKFWWNNKWNIVTSA